MLSAKCHSTHSSIDASIIQGEQGFHEFHFADSWWSHKGQATGRQSSVPKTGCFFFPFKMLWHLMTFFTKKLTNINLPSIHQSRFRENFEGCERAKRANNQRPVTCQECPEMKFSEARERLRLFNRPSLGFCCRNLHPLKLP